MILLYLVSFEWIPLLWYCCFSLLIAVKTSCSPRPYSQQRLLESFLKTIWSSEKQPWLLRFHRRERWPPPPPPAKGEADSNEMNLQGETSHYIHTSFPHTISCTCKSNLNPRSELLYTENLSTAAEISKLQYKNGKRGSYFMIFF